METMDKYKDYAYVVFRVLIGILFFLHGTQKLLGWFGGSAAGLASLLWWAGLIELVAGIALVLGLFTRWVAAISAVEMAVAYVMVHASQGLNPLLNKGELALLYLVAFLVLATRGAGKWGLQKD